MNGEEKFFQSKATEEGISRYIPSKDKVAIEKFNRCKTNI